MKTILFGLVSVALVGCGVQKATEDTRDLVRTSNGIQEAILEGIKDTLQATEELKSLTALQNMTAPENTVFLDPPVQMMPFAEIFVEHTSELNLTKAAYVLLNTAMLPVQDPTPEQKQKQAVAFAAFRAISGLMPDAKIQTITQAQIIRGGRFRDTALMMLAARYVFIRDVLFLTLLEKSQLLTVGSLEEAAARFRSMRSVASLPFAPKAPMQVPPQLQSKLGVDDKEKLQALGQKADRMFKEDLPEDVYQAHAELLRTFQVE